MGRGILGNAIARIFRLDDINAISSVAPEVMPTVSLWERPEFWALAGGSFGVCRVARVGVASETQKALLLNPASSGVLTIVERILPDSGSTIYFGMAPPSALPDVGTYIQSSVAHRDSRRVWEFAPLSGLATQLHYASGVTSGIAQGSLSVEAEIELGYILSPGWGLHFQGNAETDLGFTLFFRERSADSGELNVL